MIRGVGSTLEADWVSKATPIHRVGLRISRLRSYIYEPEAGRLSEHQIVVDRTMARGLRHHDPRCGRGHFDWRTGWEWAFGPLDEIAYSIPDVPWPTYWRAMNPRNEVLFSNANWAVTSEGLEPLHSGDPEKFEASRIPADRLLRTFKGIYGWPLTVALLLSREYWVTFEEAFREALRLHARKHRLILNEELLATSFRRASAIARKRTHFIKQQEAARPRGHKYLG
jgi:hypothetical protein